MKKTSLLWSIHANATRNLSQRARKDGGRVVESAAPARLAWVLFPSLKWRLMEAVPGCLTPGMHMMHRQPNAHTHKNTLNA